MKAVPGGKTDVRDAEWIAQMLEHGLLSPSFVPPPPIRHLRVLTRYREQLMGDWTSPDLAQALEGPFSCQHAQLAKSIIDWLDRVNQALVEIDATIAIACEPWARQIELLQTIPGVGPKVAQVIMSEAGDDMSQFPHGR